MPRRFSGSAAVLAHLDHVPGVAALRLALQRKQDPCPRAEVVYAAAQHEPCPAPASDSGSPRASSLPGPQSVPDGCAANGTQWVAP